MSKKYCISCGHCYSLADNPKFCGSCGKNLTVATTAAKRTNHDIDDESSVDGNTPANFEGCKPSFTVEVAKPSIYKMETLASQTKTGFSRGAGPYKDSTEIIERMSRQSPVISDDQG